MKKQKPFVLFLIFTSLFLVCSSEFCEIITTEFNSLEVGSIEQGTEIKSLSLTNVDDSHILLTYLENQETVIYKIYNLQDSNYGLPKFINEFRWSISRKSGIEQTDACPKSSHIYEFTTGFIEVGDLGRYKQVITQDFNIYSGPKKKEKGLFVGVKRTSNLEHDHFHCIPWSTESSHSIIRMEESEILTYFDLFSYVTDDRNTDLEFYPVTYKQSVNFDYSMHSLKEKEKILFHLFDGIDAHDGTQIIAVDSIANASDTYKPIKMVKKNYVVNTAAVDSDPSGYPILGINRFCVLEYDECNNGLEYYLSNAYYDQEEDEYLNISDYLQNNLNTRFRIESLPIERNKLGIKLVSKLTKIPYINRFFYLVEYIPENDESISRIYYSIFDNDGKQLTKFTELAPEIEGYQSETKARFITDYDPRIAISFINTHQEESKIYLKVFTFPAPIAKPTSDITYITVQPNKKFLYTIDPELFEDFNQKSDNLIFTVTTNNHKDIGTKDLVFDPKTRRIESNTITAMDDEIRLRITVKNYCNLENNMILYFRALNTNSNCDTKITLNDILENQKFEVNTEKFEFKFDSFSFLNDDGTFENEIYYDAVIEGTDDFLPEWINFNPLTRKFWGTTLNIQPQVLAIKVVAFNKCGNNATDTFEVMIEKSSNCDADSAVNIVNTIPNQDDNVNEQYSYTIPVDTFENYNSNNDQLSYSATDNTDQPLPSWLTFDSDQRQFEGTLPSTGDTLTIKVTAANECLNETTTSFTLTWNDIVSCSSTDLVVDGHQFHPINTNTAYTQKNAQIKSFSTIDEFDERFIIVYQSDHESNNLYSVYGQIFYSSNGSAVDDLFLVHSENYLLYSQTTPTVDILQFKFPQIMVCYKDDDQGIYLQMFNLNGTKYLDAFLFDETQSSTNPYLKTIGKYQSAAAVAFEDSDNIYATIVNDEGHQFQGKFLVNTENSETIHTNPKIESLQARNLFVVVWERLYNTANSQICLKTFSSYGDNITEQVFASPSNLDQRNPSIAALENLQRFIIVWEEGNTTVDFDIYGQIYDYDQKIIKDKFLINGITQDEQLFPIVTKMLPNKFAIVYNSNDNPSYYDVKVTLLNEFGDKLLDDYALPNSPQTGGATTNPLVASVGPINTDKTENTIMVCYETIEGEPNINCDIQELKRPTLNEDELIADQELIFDQEFSFDFSNSLFQDIYGQDSTLKYRYEYSIKNSLDLGVLSSKLPFLHLDSVNKRFYGYLESFQFTNGEVTLFSEDKCGMRTGNTFAITTKTGKYFCPQGIDFFQNLISYENPLLQSCCTQGNTDEIIYTLNSDEVITISNRKNIKLILAQTGDCDQDISSIKFKQLEPATDNGKIAFSGAQNIIFTSQHKEDIEYVFENVRLDLNAKSSVYFYSLVKFVNTKDSMSLPLIKLTGDSFVQFSIVQFYNLDFQNFQNGILNIEDSSSKIFKLQCHDCIYDTEANDIYPIYLNYTNPDVFKRENMLISFTGIPSVYIESHADIPSDTDYNYNNNYFVNWLPSEKLIIHNSLVQFNLNIEDSWTINNTYIDGKIRNIENDFEPQMINIKNSFEWVNGYLQFTFFNVMNQGVIRSIYKKELTLDQSRIYTDVNASMTISVEELYLSNGAKIDNKGKMLFSQSDLFISGTEENLLNTNKFFNENNLTITRTVRMDNIEFNNYPEAHLYLVIDDQSVNNFISPIELNSDLIQLRGKFHVDFSNWTERIYQQYLSFIISDSVKDFSVFNELELVPNQEETDKNLFYQIANHKQYQSQIKFLSCDLGTYQPDTNEWKCINCNAGRRASQYGLTYCQNCTAGTYSEERSSTCNACALGYYSDQDEAPKCDPCPNGTIGIPDNLTICEPCPAASSSDSGSTICHVCDPGSYAETNASAQCYPCALGMYQESSESTECKKCLIGSYADQMGSSTCKLCAKGTYNRLQAQDKCIDCPLGSYNNEMGQTSCTQCQKGYKSGSTGSTSCEKCDYDHYQPDAASSTCLSCPLNSQTLNKGATSLYDCVCKIDYYGSNGGACTKCPNGSLCDSVGQLNPIPKVGYWNSQDQPSNVKKCVNEEACPGNGIQECAFELGYSGQLCQYCLDRFYQIEGHCYECPNNMAFRITVIVLILFFLMGIMFLVAKKAKAYFGSFAIAFSFLQILSIILDLKIDWPSGIQGTLKLTSMFNFNPDWLALECSLNFNYEERWILIMLSPLLFLLMALIVYLLVFLQSIFVERYGYRILDKFPSLSTVPSRTTENKFFYYCYSVRYQFMRMFLSGYSRDERKGLKKNLINSYTTLLSFIYLLLSLQIFQIFDCSVEDENGDREFEADPQHNCFDSWWWKLAPWAIFCGVIYIIGIPIALFWLMWKYSKKLDEQKFDEIFGLMCSRYSKSYFYWECMVMFRKLLIVAFQVFLTKSPVEQMICCITVILVALLLQAAYKPYLALRHNYLEFVLLLVSEIILFSGLIFSSPDYFGENSQQIMARSLLTLIWGGVAILSIIILFEIRHRFRIKSGKDVDENLASSRLLKGDKIAELIHKKPPIKLILYWIASLYPRERKQLIKLHTLVLKSLKYRKNKYQDYSLLVDSMLESYHQLFHRDVVKLFTKFYDQEANILQKFKVGCTAEILYSHLMSSEVAPLKKSRGRSSIFNLISLKSRKFSSKKVKKEQIKNELFKNSEKSEIELNDLNKEKDGSSSSVFKSNVSSDYTSDEN
ncbi:insulin-like growth factor binding protein [Anaeramoeba flamelloides]|uniref:Insulin-like growth factor binding protein n=1 Tax=Anaeramoeba flamelloides TaxID=1746091 RepID=A0ABQ8YNV8_9EUKA|nr:insulin-like growth factor binding protein [Anaeramoeba flamelloides]